MKKTIFILLNMEVIKIIKYNENNKKDRNNTYIC